jgi:hypothetical protein
LGPGVKGFKPGDKVIAYIDVLVGSHDKPTGIFALGFGKKELKLYEF